MSISVFRVYADANGNPAPYSDKNVPLRPKRWFKISLKGCHGVPSVHGLNPALSDLTSAALPRFLLLCDKDF